jgi:hypothetical protein
MLADRVTRRTYPEGGEVEEVREGYDPDNIPTNIQPPDHNPGAPVGATGGEQKPVEQQHQEHEAVESVQWQRRDYSESDNPDDDDEDLQTPSYGNLEESNPWGSLPSRP